MTKIVFGGVAVLVVAAALWWSLGGSEGPDDISAPPDRAATAAFVPADEPTAAEIAAVREDRPIRGETYAIGELTVGGGEPPAGRRTVDEPDGFLGELPRNSSVPISGRLQFEAAEGLPRFLIFGLSGIQAGGRRVDYAPKHVEVEPDGRFAGTLRTGREGLYLVLVAALGREKGGGNTEEFHYGVVRVVPFDEAAPELGAVNGETVRGDRET